MNIISSQHFKEKFGMHPEVAYQNLNQTKTSNYYIRGNVLNPLYEVFERNKTISNLIDDENKEWTVVYHVSIRFQEDDKSDWTLAGTSFYHFKMTEQEIKKYLAFA